MYQIQMYQTQLKTLVINVIFATSEVPGMLIIIYNINNVKLFIDPFLNIQYPVEGDVQQRACHRSQEVYK